MDEKEKNINFRGTEEYRRKLARAALDRGVKVQGLLERAVEAYLSGGQAASNEAGNNPIAGREDKRYYLGQIINISERISAISGELAKLRKALETTTEEHSVGLPRADNQDEFMRLSQEIEDATRDVENSAREFFASPRVAKKPGTGNRKKVSGG